MKTLLVIALALVACASPSEPQFATGTEPESSAYVKVIESLAASDNEPQAGDHMPWCPKSDDCMLCVCLCAFGPKDPPKNNVPLPRDYGWVQPPPCWGCPPTFGGRD